MERYMIATHGNLAEELKAALCFIAGEDWLSKFFRGFRQKFGGQLWGREKIKAKN